MKYISAVLSILFFVLLLYVAGLVSPLDIYGIGVDFQVLVVFLTASLIGVLGVLSILIFALLTMLGFPLLTGGRGGFEILMGPGGGIIVSYVLAGIVLGLLTNAVWKKYYYAEVLSIALFALVVMFYTEVFYISVIISVSVLSVQRDLFIFFLPNVAFALLSSLVSWLSKRYFPLIKEK